MKNIIILFVALLFIDITEAQNVGIGTTSPQAALDVSSTTNGLLPPRLTFAQRNAILNPVEGLLIWCINCSATGEIEVFNGTNWTNMVGGATGAGTVTICNQTWMTKNLDIAKYRNGDPIPQVSDQAAWNALTTGAWCWYNNDSATYAATYGKLYNWYAVNDPRGLAPAGWHIPSDAEWTTLSGCLGGDAVSGGKMKETGTTHWLTPNNGATNSSGFTGLPGGERLTDGTFGNVSYVGIWWTSTEIITTVFAKQRHLTYLDGNLYSGSNNKYKGRSVRCVRD